MKEPVRIGHLFYGLAMIVYGIQQLVYGNFRNVQLPAWQSSLPLLPFWAYVTGAGLVVAGVAIILRKKARPVLLVLGGIFLFLFLFVHVPFEMFGEVNSSLHLALWVDALKELALSGGAFVMAGTFRPDGKPASKSAIMTFLEKLIPFGHMLFCITMIAFGLTHFMYAEHVATLVPHAFPDHLFWTYLAAVALIGSGFAIILRIRQGAIAMLLSLMLFLWVIVLHVPRAIDDPFVQRGNELSSAFDALAFSGIAWVIALRNLRKDLNEIMTWQND